MAVFIKHFRLNSLLTSGSSCSGNWIYARILVERSPGSLKSLLAAPGAVLSPHIRRDYSTEVKKSGDKEQQTSSGSVLMEVLSKEEPKELTVGAKVVRAGKDFTYLIAIFAGFGLMGFLFYSVGSEFFSSASPSSIFSKALKRVKADESVKAALGEPITGHGEESGRGRRKQLNYLEYEVDGVTYMRMKFHVSGSKRKGETVLELKKNEAGKYALRFMFVELAGYPPQTIILEDNR
ncbi:PREDICTED: mitochondrial import inner membrane translocase subunit Tim21-like [Amphimedon queenslandica]|uniref:Mitochondrial import inner membrane translocase subunit Tim21 n=1 Tax=Amphimedon queenslandica TaxID=400682 RepID=A0A1X7VG37_AMPQE|nr:PREDICTED: mitochondrial import inner membrane translocase subunit Tim21-like [Amphimedon queenslandica]|eukprot:XP_003384418.1 PREDICTED: mitochondrial import inner membrane translocase subunit Tim21-like [Amphimedon queenslandica]